MKKGTRKRGGRGMGGDAGRGRGIRTKESDKDYENTIKPITMDANLKN